MLCGTMDRRRRHHPEVRSAMSEMASLPTPIFTHRRQSKFTPTTIRQITNLLERGRSKEEIAEIIGVTPATLQVTCSKLGISLRRPSEAARARRVPVSVSNGARSCAEETE